MARFARTLLIVCTIASCSVASSALAQGIDDSNANTPLTSTSTSTTTSGLTIAGIIVTGGLLAANDPSPDSLRALAMYLEENTPAIERDLALGAGGSVDDLASAFGVPHDDRARFGKMLRAERTPLLSLVDHDEVTTEHAARFIIVVLDAMRSDTQLARILTREG